MFREGGERRPGGAVRTRGGWVNFTWGQEDVICDKARDQEEKAEKDIMLGNWWQLKKL